MLDIKFIRDNPDLVEKNRLRRKGKISVSELLAADSSRLELLQKIEAIRATRNKQPNHKPSEPELVELKKQSEELKSLESDYSLLERNYQDKLLRIPNMSSPLMPNGIDDDDHVELAVWLPESGYLPQDKLGIGSNAIQYMPKKTGLHHVDIGKNLDIIDVEQSVKVAGSRFAYLKGDAVLLQFALFDLLKNKLIVDKFIPMVVPIMVKERVLYGTSHFPEGRDQVYQVSSDFLEDKDPLFLVGSSEPPLFAYYMDKLLNASELPAKMFAYTPCFRSEVGSWGKDVRGIKRVHQFDKLEMDIVTTQESSHEVMEYLRSLNEWFMQALKLPYRIINKCAGDCGYTATYLQYDLEGWLPTQGEFIELGSNTNDTDYQARRLNIQYVDTDGVKKFAHTVNDTGIPMGRMIIAVLDNYQNSDGTVTVPEVLRPLMGKDLIK